MDAEGNSGLRLDVHVHLVGTGSHGSGCSYPRSGRYRWMVPLLARCFGLRAGAVAGDFDERYLRRLERYVRTSSLDGVVLLAMDHARRDDGTVIAGVDAFYVPNDGVFAAADRFPGFLPGVSIHPARPDALAELERCLECGAALLKLIPNCQNVDLNAPAFRPFWARMAEAGLPLLVHTGREPALEELRPEFGRPGTLAGPLAAGVTVIAAHCGGIYQDEFVEMLARWPGLWGDTAAFTTPFSARNLAPLLRAPVVQRLVHGSDAPVPVTGLGAWWNGELPLRTAWRLGALRNPLERDCRIKAALGFPPAVFARGAEVLRPAAVRAFLARRASQAAAAAPRSRAGVACDPEPTFVREVAHRR